MTFELEYNVRFFCTQSKDISRDKDSSHSIRDVSFLAHLCYSCIVKLLLKRAHAHHLFMDQRKRKSRGLIFSVTLLDDSTIWNPALTTQSS